MPIHTYIFATSRGDDFEIEGTSPEDAYNNLTKQEESQGTLWRCHDRYRNMFAIMYNGFRPLYPSSKKDRHYEVAYKVKG